MENAIVQTCHDDSLSGLMALQHLYAFEYTLEIQVLALRRSYVHLLSQSWSLPWHCVLGHTPSLEVLRLLLQQPEVKDSVRERASFVNFPLIPPLPGV